MKEFALDLKNLDYLSPIIKAFLNHDEAIMKFTDYNTDLSQMSDLIKQKTNSYQYRTVLNEVLKTQYQQLPMYPEVQQNLDLLYQQNTFTITAAHQPNLLMGPNYFVIKILEAVGLCQSLQRQFPQYHFVPVYYMGSEDADMEELNNIHVFNEKLSWQTEQTGAFGRMIIDQAFIQLLKKLEGIIATNQCGIELIEKMKQSFQINKTIQEATLDFVHSLFGKYGLIILCPDQPVLKKCLLPFALKELKEHHCSTVLENQTKPNFPFEMTIVWRDINFFILEHQHRLKIKHHTELNTFEVGENKYTYEEFVHKISLNPELISPNVVLRPVFQELILPNIIFIGGSGEISYWLQLKDVFNSFGMKLPILKLRNTFTFIKNRIFQQWLKINIPLEYIFKPAEDIKHYFLYHLNDYQYDLTSLVEKQEQLMAELKIILNKHDKSLESHLNNIKSEWAKTLKELEIKIKRSQKRKEIDTMNIIEKMKLECFPKNTLQERLVNFSEINIFMGTEMFDQIILKSQQLDSKFNIITY